MPLRSPMALASISAEPPPTLMTQSRSIIRVTASSTTRAGTWTTAESRMRELRFGISAWMRRARAILEGLETIKGDVTRKRPSSVGRRATVPEPKTTRGEMTSWIKLFLVAEADEADADADAEADADADVGLESRRGGDGPEADPVGDFDEDLAVEVAFAVLSGEVL
jgi:hypothetical protein